MVHDPREAVETFIKKAGPSSAYAIATVVRTQNATSAKPGAKAIVTDGGELIGWVGGRHPASPDRQSKPCPSAIKSDRPRWW